MEKAKSVLDYFEPYLGRIEIMGSAGRIERVYFEITQSYIDQWEKPQIKVKAFEYIQWTPVDTICIEKKRNYHEEIETMKFFFITVI